MNEYLSRPTFPEVEARLEQMNAALHRYEHAQGRSEKNQADQDFSNCFDWLSECSIPFYFDEATHTWEFGAPGLRSSAP